MRIRFSGAEADDHRLEAYEGLKSLDGLIRVATIAAHYAATGEVRFRAPYSNLLQTQLSEIRNGSFEFVFDQLSRFADAVEEGGGEVGDSCGEDFGFPEFQWEGEAGEHVEEVFELVKGGERRAAFVRGTTRWGRE